MNIHPINDQTWLICGGRDFADQEMFDSAMGDLLRMWGCPRRIVHGGATGADTMAGKLAERLAIDVAIHPAEWQRFGPSAGPRRNQQMLDQERPTLVIAFPGNNGTNDMMRRARKAEVAVVEIKPANPPHNVKGE